jgi:ligand-binding SRPBCC domain-containing protein
MRTLERSTWVPYPADEVFAFFSEAANLERLTPPSLSFHILTPSPIEMKAGALIDYTIKLGPFPMRWKTLIGAWEPPNRFVDDQLKGPYLRWHHEHTFEARDGGTDIRDRVEYLAPGWILEPLIHALFIAPQLRKIFDFRSEAIQKLFPPKAS